MLEYKLAKAKPIGDQKIEDVTITIDQEIPKIKNSEKNYLKIYDSFYEDQAKTLYKALEFLPGGTIDRLIILLLNLKKSHFTVCYKGDIDVQ